VSRARRPTLVVLAIAAIVLAAVSLLVGKVWIPLGVWADAADPLRPILIELRLPRTLLALVVGAALGVSGAAMQGYARNPLADPGTLGVSAMAALGAVGTLYFGAGAQASWIVAGMALVGALVGVMLLMGLAGGASSTVAFILAGVILQTAAGAGVALALSLAPNPWAVSEIVDWLMGSLTDRSFADLRIAAPLVAVGAGLLFTIGRSLDALTLGEDGARSLGVDMARLRWSLAVGVALTAGASVAVTGVVGFVGLIVPHLLRPLVGAQPSRLLLPSALGGAVLVLAADILVRLTPAASEVKLGVAMTVLGAPFFLALLVSMRRRMA
jgi:iron complex transport system permease protein